MTEDDTLIRLRMPEAKKWAFWPGGTNAFPDLNRTYDRERALKLPWPVSQQQALELRQMHPLVEFRVERYEINGIGRHLLARDASKKTKKARRR